MSIKMPGYLIFGRTTGTIWLHFFLSAPADDLRSLVLVTPEGGFYLITFDYT
jgi:hypothetical protein